MLTAMALTAASCIAIGSLPSLFYTLLPYAAEYEPYTASHVVDQMQLLAFSALAFAVLMRTGIYPPELRSVNLDVDWFYRRAAPILASGVTRRLSAFLRAIGAAANSPSRRLVHAIYRHHAPAGVLARTWPTGSMALWLVAMLLTYLLLYYV